MTSKRKRVGEDTYTVKTEQECINGFFIPVGKEIEWRNKLLSMLSVPSGESIFVPFSSINVSRGLDGSVNIVDWENFAGYVDSLKTTKKNYNQLTVQKYEKTVTELFYNIIDIVACNTADWSVIDMMNLEMIAKSFSSLKKSFWWKQQALNSMEEFKAGDLFKSKVNLVNTNWKKIVKSYSGIRLPMELKCAACGNVGCKFSKYKGDAKEDNIDLKDDDSDREELIDKTSDPHNKRNFRKPQVVIRCNKCNFRMASLEIRGKFSEMCEIFECSEECQPLYGKSDTCCVCEEKGEERKFCTECLNVCDTCCSQVCSNHTRYGYNQMYCKSCHNSY